MEVTHIHFGAGALGLGLVIPAFEKKVTNRLIFNRASPPGILRISSISKHSGYELEIFSGTKVFSRPVRNVSGRTYDSIPEYCASHLPGVDAILLTTALKMDGLKSSAGELALLCEEAQKLKIPVLIIAAENQINSQWVMELISKKISSTKGMYYLNCVVDRICNKPSLKPRKGAAPLTSVFVEEFSKIYIDLSNIKSLPQKLFERIFTEDKNDRIVETTLDFDHVVNRKKWVVNSAHLLLALYAHWNRYPTINSFTKDYPRIVDFLINDVIEIYRVALNIEGNIEIDDAIFFVALKRRLGKFPQVPYDAVTRFGGQEHLLSFFKDFHRKVAEPHILSFSASSKQRRLPFFPFHITMCLVELISSERWIVRTV